LLEERVALSHAVPDVAVSAGLRATVRGQVTTVVSQGIDTRFAQATLKGSGRTPGIGPIRVTAALNAHFVDVIPFPDQGTLTVSATGRPGALALNLTGPYSDLAPTSPKTTHLTFTVSKATGQLARFAGAQGTADLTLVTHGPSPFNPSHMTTSKGTFTLVLTLD
jgi:hypothetical protein